MPPKSVKFGRGRLNIRPARPISAAGAGAVSGPARGGLAFRAGQALSRGISRVRAAFG
jgi:hypothetical protein